MKTHLMCGSNCEKRGENAFEMSHFQINFDHRNIFSYLHHQMINAELMHTLNGKVPREFSSVVLIFVSENNSGTVAYLYDHFI